MCFFKLAMSMACWVVGPSIGKPDSRMTTFVNSRSRFSVKVAAAHTSSSMERPANQRYSRLCSMYWTGCRSERMEKCLDEARPQQPPRGGARASCAGIQGFEGLVRHGQNAIDRHPKLPPGPVRRYPLFQRPKADQRVLGRVGPVH